MNITTGKSYTTRAGNKVDITEADPHGDSFVGKLHHAAGFVYRAYSVDGRAVPLHVGTQGSDIIAEYAEPLRLKAGRIYPTRDGLGYALVLRASPDEARAKLYATARVKVLVKHPSLSNGRPFVTIRYSPSGCCTQGPSAFDLVEKVGPGMSPTLWAEMLALQYAADAMFGAKPVELCNYLARGGDVVSAEIAGPGGALHVTL